MGHRKEQVESTLRRAISGVLAKHVADPRVSGMVTVTGVDVSPDLQYAKVMVSVLPEKFEKKAVHGLRSASGHIHGLVRKAVRMRTVPRLDFRVDESLKREAAVLAAIRRAVDGEGGGGVEVDGQDQTPRAPGASKPEVPAR